MRRYEVFVDQKRCIGCGLCEETLPSTFSMGDYTAHVSNPVSESHVEGLQIAARDCPVEAISYAEKELVDLPGDEDQEGNNVEERGEIGEYKRKHRDFSEGDKIEADDSNRLQSGEYDLTIVRNGTNDD